MQNVGWRLLPPGAVLLGGPLSVLSAFVSRELPSSYERPLDFRLACLVRPVVEARQKRLLPFGVNQWLVGLA
jgi:hypothetical protein